MIRTCHEILIYGLFALWIFPVLAVGSSTASHAEWTHLDPEKGIHQYVIDAWSEEEGVPPHPVQAMLRSRDGYLWLATRGGLARFDGVRFTLFNLRNTPAFSIEDTTSIAEDDAGVLWIGTMGGGLLRYEDGDFSAHRTGTPTGDTVEDVVHYEDTLWMGTHGGLYRLAEGIPRLVPVPEELASARVGALHVDRDGTLWIGTEGRGIYCYRDGRFTVFPVPEILRQTEIHSLQPGPGTTLWVGSRDQGLYRWRDSGWETLDLSSDGAPESVYDLHQGRAGQLWVATDTALYRWQDTGLEKYTEWSEVRIRSFYEDDEGSLWVGTYKGLLRFKDGFITPFGIPEGLVDDHVRAVYGDRQGRVWFGTLGGGLHRFADGEVRAFTPENGFPSDRVWSILEASDGIFWFGTDDGLVRALPDGSGGFRAFELFTTDDGLASQRIRVVFEDPDDPGTLWLGTMDDGFHRWRDGVDAHYGTDDGLRHGDVRWIGKASTAPGDLWIGGQQGLHRFHDGRWTVYTTADGLMSHFIIGAHVDVVGQLWLGTFGGGLARFADGRFTVYTTRDGLPFNDVWCILEHDGALWLSNDQGIFRVAKRDLEAYDSGVLPEIPVTAFGYDDGMRAIEVNGGGFPAGWKDAAGDLWFPTYAGAVRLDPEGAERRPVAPPAVIEELSVDGEAIALDPPIRLAPDQSNVEFVYTGLNLRNPERLRFKYRLVGYDREWVDAGDRRKAFYTKMPPGSYTFQVMAGDEGSWSPEPAELRFTLVPHFYQTRWFAVLAVLGAALMIYGGFRARTRRIRKQNLRLREEIDRRVRVEADLEARNQEIERYIEALRASEERFSTAFRASPDAILITTLTDSKLVEVNDGFTRISGYSREEAVGRSTLDLGMWPDPEDRKRMLDTLRREGKIRNMEADFRGKSGVTFDCLLSFDIIELAGEPHILTVARDITDKKRIEEERETFVRELEQRNAELERLNYMFSHDLKNPLVSIRGFLGLLEQDIASGDGRRIRTDLQRIVAATDTMYSLLNDLLEFSRLGRAVIVPERIALADLVRRVVDPLNGQGEARDVKIEVAPRLPVVVGDRAMLLQALQSLTDNAIKFVAGQSEPRVEVGARRDDGTTVIFVRDNGIGVDPRYHERIFRLFERLDQRVAGTGVGLALVKRIVDLHGGRVWIESEGRGKGSTFCFTLPDGEDLAS